MDEIKLIYVGERFYDESSTIMSSIYTVDGKRYDWGLVQGALKRGKTVNIRPATEAEMKFFKTKLAKIKEGKQNG